MNLKKEFEKLIDKKKAEIFEAQKTIAAAEAYIQAMTDAIKKLPKESAAPSVRPGSAVEKIRDAILTAGKPLHVNEIIEALGRPEDANTKGKIAGLLGWYIGKGKIFTKTAPNTYGLVEVAAIPANFGEEAEGGEQSAAVG